MKLFHFFELIISILYGSVVHIRNFLFDIGIFNQKKFEEAAIAFAEFNSIFPNDSRFQETTLLIAESAVNFAPKDQLCDILNQSIDFMVNPSDKFIKKINTLKNEKKCSTE